MHRTVLSFCSRFLIGMAVAAGLMPFAAVATSGSNWENSPEWIALENSVRPAFLDPSYRMKFHDEFNTFDYRYFNGATSGKATWYTALPWGGQVNDANHEMQLYMDPTRQWADKSGPAPNPFSIENNALTIKTVRCPSPEKCKSSWNKQYEWTSGMIISQDKFSFHGGYVEARMKLPQGSGMWPAFWLGMQGTAGHPREWPPEIDIVEWYGSQPTFTTNNLWWKAMGTAQKDPQKVAADDDLSQSWHLWGMLWTEDRISFYMDNKLLRVITLTPAQKTFYADKKMFLMFNTAVGPSTWNIPNAATPSATELKIDYVRYWQRP